MSKRVRPYQGSSSMWTAVVVTVGTLSLWPCGLRPRVVKPHSRVLVCPVYVRCQRVVFAVGKKEKVREMLA